MGKLGGEDSAEDAEKLYEIGYHSGAVGLYIGCGGRGLAALLRGARAGCSARGGPSPQLYACVEVEGRAALLAGLREGRLQDDCVVYPGGLRELRCDLPVTPSVVVLEVREGARLAAALAQLRSMLAKGTPVLCRAFPKGERAKELLAPWVERGGYDGLGDFGGSALLRADGIAGGMVRGLSPRTFAVLRDALLARLLRETDAAAVRAELPRLTRSARRELLRDAARKGRSGYGEWPYADTQALPLPATLPDGAPWPRISIVTPSYNQGAYLEQTILSVANQGYPNVEHIVMDGGSTDETAAVIERRRQSLARAVSERDRGQSHAINKGMALATGEILTWLNSDDMLAPGALAAVALAFHTSRADVVAGVCQIQRGGTVLEQHLTCCADGPLPLDDLLDLERCWMPGQFFYQPEVMFARRIWEQAGGRVDETMMYSMDYELWLRFAEQGARLHVIGRPVALFRVHEEQKTTAQQAFVQELEQVREAFCRRTGRARLTQAEAGGERLGLRMTFFNDTGYHAGAGLAHQRLAQGCATAGHEVTPLAISASSTYDAHSPVTTEEVLKAVAESKPDVVLVGNLHSAALPPSLLGAIAKRWPTLLVLHDQWALTGRCAYTGGCGKYLTGCDHTCPTPNEYPQLAPEKIGPAWEAKRRALAGTGAPLLLANSEWTARFAGEALAARGTANAGAAVETIRLGFPLDVFRPRNRRACRELLGLPQERFIILTSGTSADDPRKGLGHLAAALEQLALPDLLVVSVGHFNPHQPLPIPGMRAMGYFTEPEKVALLYSAVDLFVGPSLEEAFGQVFVEAAACGVPAIGYPTGGVGEAVADGITGRLAAAVEPDALADAILELYCDPELRRDLGRWARLYVENEWSLVSAYQRLFVAWQRSKWRERLGLRRKIRLLAEAQAAPAVRYLDPAYPRWRAVSGFDHWEGPYPADNLPRCRWVLGPTARVEVRAERRGRHLLFLQCRNYWEGQRVRIVYRDAVLGEYDVPVTGNVRDCTLRFEVELEAGAHELELYCWQWDAKHPDRPCAILVLGIGLLPAEVGGQ